MKNWANNSAGTLIFKTRRILEKINPKTKDITIL